MQRTDLWFSLKLPLPQKHSRFIPLFSKLLLITREPKSFINFSTKGSCMRLSLPGFRSFTKSQTHLSQLIFHFAQLLKATNLKESSNPNKPQNSSLTSKNGN